MYFYLAAENQIYKGTINDSISLIPEIRISGSTYLDYSDGHLFTICDNGIAVFKDNKIIYQDLSQSVKPSHITYIKKYNLILSANYHLGSLTIYAFNQENTKIIETIKYQSNSHIHQSVYDSYNDLIYVTDLGCDLLYVYKFSKNKLSLVKQIKLAEKSGPRHLTISQSKIYLLCEYSNLIYTIDIKSLLVVDQTKSLDFNYQSADSSAIRITSDFKHLYALNRSTDYITHFRIDDNGKLTLVKCYPTFGQHARDFNFVGNYLVIANKDSNNLSLFKRLVDGTLEFIDNNTVVASPMMVLNLN